MSFLVSVVRDNQGTYVVPIERNLILVHSLPPEVLEADMNTEHREDRRRDQVEPPEKREPGGPQEQREEHRVLRRLAKHDRDRATTDGTVALDVLEVLRVDCRREDAKWLDP